ncbi:MAG TPA: GNAT family N-acetyltransferase [Acidobacteriaceae bacterium]
MLIRGAVDSDHEVVWAMLEPVIRAGEVFALPREMDRASALAYWFAPTHTVFVLEDGGAIAGSYYIQPNQAGPGSHVANCGYLTAGWAEGRGFGGAMCAHSLAYACEAGYRAMQFNLVVSTNLAAVHLWGKYGFRTLARLPGAFLHPVLGYVDALVLWRSLELEESSL